MGVGEVGVRRGRGYANERWFMLMARGAHEEGGWVQQSSHSGGHTGGGGLVPCTRASWLARGCSPLARGGVWLCTRMATARTAVHEELGCSHWDAPRHAHSVHEGAQSSRDNTAGRTWLTPACTRMPKAHSKAHHRARSSCKSTWEHPELAPGCTRVHMAHTRMHQDAQGCTRVHTTHTRMHQDTPNQHCNTPSSHDDARGHPKLARGCTRAHSRTHWGTRALHKGMRGCSGLARGPIGVHTPCTRTNEGTRIHHSTRSSCTTTHPARSHPPHPKLFAHPLESGDPTAPPPPPLPHLKGHTPNSSPRPLLALPPPSP